MTNGSDDLKAEFACVALSTVLFVASVLVEDKEYGSEQYSFHVSRSAFLCKLRLPSFEAEFALVHLPIMLSGMVTCLYLVAIIRKVNRVVSGVRNSQKEKVWPVPSFFCCT